MKDGYELFPNSPFPPNHFEVTVCRDGTFTFNAAARRLFEGRKIDAVLLMWAKKTREIGLWQADEDDLDSFNIYLDDDDCFGFRSEFFFKEVEWRLAGDSCTLLGTWDDFELILELEPLP